jgi:hypothetical protein
VLVKLKPKTKNCLQGAFIVYDFGCSGRQEGDEKVTGLYVSRLVRFFVRSSGSNEGVDEYEHVGAILVNITRLEAGRKLLLNASKGLFRQILPQIDSRSVVRRQGVS